MTAGYMSIRDNFWPLAVNANPDLHVQGYVLLDQHDHHDGLLPVILASATWRWMLVLTGRVPQMELADA